MQASPVDDDDATTTGARRSGEGLGHVTTGSQLSDLCFVAMGAKPGLSDKHDVDSIILHERGDFKPLAGHVVAFHRLSVE